MLQSIYGRELFQAFGYIVVVVMEDTEVAFPVDCRMNRIAHEGVIGTVEETLICILHGVTDLFFIENHIQIAVITPAATDIQTGAKTENLSGTTDFRKIEFPFCLAVISINYSIRGHGSSRYETAEWGIRTLGDSAALYLWHFDE